MRVQNPPAYDQRPNIPEALNQSTLGSCTGHAIANGHLKAQMTENRNRLFLPSRLFIYYNERREEDTIQSDAGASIRTGIKTIAKYGVCEEVFWGYNIEKFTDEPPLEAYENAKKNKVLKYQRLVNLDHIRTCLSQDHPVIFGFSVYESFESDEVARTGIVPVPKFWESIMGGHAVLAVGYDDEKRHLIVLNSWGQDWGDKGCFYLPYDFVEDEQLSSDYWTIFDIA